MNHETRFVPLIPRLTEELEKAIREAPLDALGPALADVAGLGGLILGRLLEGMAAKAPARRFLTAEEAAKLTGLKARWFYERGDKLPFAVRPSPGRLRFDEAGLVRWMQQAR